MSDDAEKRVERLLEQNVHLAARLGMAKGMVEMMRSACELTVREMERYYRDGSHPDLSPVLRASKSAIEAIEAIDEVSR